jgi:hypothetical protein
VRTAVLWGLQDSSRREAFSTNNQINPTYFNSGAPSQNRTKNQGNKDQTNPCLHVGGQLMLFPLYIQYREKRCIGKRSPGAWGGPFIHSNWGCRQSHRQSKMLVFPRAVTSERGRLSAYYPLAQFHRFPPPPYTWPCASQHIESVGYVLFLISTVACYLT